MRPVRLLFDSLSARSIDGISRVCRPPSEDGESLSTRWSPTGKLRCAGCNLVYSSGTKACPKRHPETRVPAIRPDATCTEGR